jgi:DNA repair exonuclease SbcCD ATPase subunit
MRLDKIIDGHKNQLSELDDEVAGLPPQAELQASLKRFENEKGVFKSQLDKEAGALEKVEESIKKSAVELNEKKFQGIEERYKLKHIQLHALRSANKDLDRYYQALDKALMRFHEMKMEEINKTVKEYWQNTYQGQDIDTIEIKADVESSTPNRRSHNYRLIMRHKSLAELDMRGRCRWATFSFGMPVLHHHDCHLPAAAAAAVLGRKYWLLWSFVWHLLKHFVTTVAFLRLMSLHQILIITILVVLLKH